MIANVIPTAFRPEMVNTRRPIGRCAVFPGRLLVVVAREDTFGDQRSPRLDVIRMVDVQYLNRHASHRRQSQETRPTPSEMIAPAIASWVEQGGERSRPEVDSREIWALGSVASRRGQREVSALRLAMMLFGDDMVDLKRPWIERLRQTAILTESLRSVAHSPVKFER